MLIKIKPLSVNGAWKGKKFKTQEYKNYEEEMLLQLQGSKLVDIIEGGMMKVVINFGFSSKNADIDNPVKPLLDILQKFYGFNDKNIYQLDITKENVKKGEEFIDVDIFQY